MRTFGQHFSISVTTFSNIKNCLNIKNLEKKIIYILIVALKFRKPEQNCARMGLPMENDLLATTSEQIKEPESKFDTQKNLLSLAFESKHFVLIDHGIRHITIFLKILKLTKLVMDLRKEVMWYHFFIHINKFL